MATLLWLDPDGMHLWVSHLCHGKRETMRLPFPAWHLDESGRLAADCSIYCNPTIGGCGLHLERVPIVPQSMNVPNNSPAKIGLGQRTLKSWRSKATSLKSKLRSYLAGR